MEIIQIDLLKPSKFSEDIYSSIPPYDLIQSIKANGILLPIWISSQNVIISGHRRVNACKALGLTEITYEIKDYSDLLVIESNRYRDKTWTEKLKEAEALEAILKPQAKENLSLGGKNKPLLNSAKVEIPINVREESAKALGTSHDTLYKAKTIAREKPELLTEVDEGKRSIHSAYNQIKISKQKEERSFNKPLPLPQGKYKTIVIDPPWPVEKIVREVSPAQGTFDYPTMTLEAIKAFPLRDIAVMEGCHIYLWTTHKFLPVAFDILQAWGVKYQCLMTWVKNVGFTPFSFMYSTEHVLFGRIGHLDLLVNGKRLDFAAPVTRHSEKPGIFYELVSMVSPEPRIDVFGRKERPGFATYGNEG